MTTTRSRNRQVQKASARLAYVHAILDDEREGLARRSDASLAASIERTFAHQTSFGQSVFAAGPPAIGTVRRWLRTFEKGASAARVLRDRTDRPAPFHPAVRSALDRYTRGPWAGRRPLAECYARLMDELIEFNNSRDYSGQVRVPIPSKARFVRLWRAARALETAAAKPRPDSAP